MDGKTILKSIGWIAFGMLIALKGDFILETSMDARTRFPVFNWVGLLFMAAGLPFIGYGLLQLWRKRSTTGPVKMHFICPKCESVHAFPQTDAPVCPHDSTRLEPLEGYYDRHPERKNQEVTPNQ